MTASSRPLLVALALAAALSSAAPAWAQPAQGRTPNLEGTWVTPSGSLFFSFLHRFSVAGGKVSNFPTFHLSAGILDWMSLGALYSSQPGYFNKVGNNELQPFFKQRWLDEQAGAPVSLSLTEAYNVTVGSPDLELALAKTLGPVGLHLAARGLGQFAENPGQRVFLGAGASYALTPFLSLAADAGTPVFGPKGAATEPALAWGVGAQMAIPYSPHTLSVHASNAASGSIHGASIPTDTVRYGFDFTIPLANGKQWLDIFTPVAAVAPTAALSAIPTPVASADATPVVAADDPVAKAFFQSRCTPCHGQGGIGGFGPDLRPVEAKGDTFITNRIRKGSPKGMPAFEALLKPAELDALVAYVKSLK